MTRPSWPQYFMRLAEVVALRASCPRAMCGTVLVDENNRVIGTGFNGAPAGKDDCFTAGCIIVDNHCLRALHSELNAVLTAAKYGAKTHNATAYMWADRNGEPEKVCTRCRLLLEGAGVSAIIERQS